MEVSEPLMDCNFPEMLAVDLEQSADVFRSKNLTAGPPVPSLVDDGSKRRYSLQDSSAPRFSPHSKDILARMKSLQRLDQQYSQVVMQTSNSWRKSSDTSASDSSYEAEMPSVATRDRSVSTAATSPGSGRFSPIEKSTSSVEKLPQYSWVDLEVENNTGAAGSESRSYSMGNVGSPPRVLDGRGDTHDSRSMSMGAKVAQAMFPDPFTAFSSPDTSFSAQIGSPTSPVKGVTYGQPVKLPQRRSSLNCKDRFLSPPQFLSPPHHRDSPRSPPTPSRFIPANVSMLNVTPTRLPTPPGNDTDVMMMHDGARNMVSPDLSMAHRSPSIRSGYMQHRTTSSLASIEQWLEQILDFGTPVHQQAAVDSLSSRIPVPQDVLDTLRISVSCFPETMLLCSSLSIETIRSHARKIKYRATNLENDNSALQDASSKGSKWKWFTGRKLPTEPPLANSQTSKGGQSESLSGNSDSKTACPDWSSVKNIFPTASDYLCDALYAHILVFNYITTICPRPTVAPTPPRPESNSSRESESPRPSNVSDGTKIPRKAASLLGLPNDSAGSMPEPASPTGSVLRHSPSFFSGKRPASRHANGNSSRSAEDHDKPLRELRLGLAKCIVRLVLTARTAPDEIPAPVIDPRNLQEVDPVILRALCEVVRCAEDRS
ncbi:hypothetical protein BX600DRAFT_513017 [Xylariales sp. PMI_506]|nr:hypothetical protein BX600DRAFT_513017 [Xylariales sp. PMI_506]